MEQQRVMAIQVVILFDMLWYALSLILKFIYKIKGGPLMYYSNNKWYLYGIASYILSDTNGTCLMNYPSYFTIVPNYLSWIYQTISILQNTNLNFIL